MVIEALKERFKDLHPLIFLRSQEKAKDQTDLFDILDSCPKVFPICWSEEDHCWKITELLYEELKND